MKALVEVVLTAKFLQVLEGSRIAVGHRDGND